MDTHVIALQPPGCIVRRSCTLWLGDCRYTFERHHIRAALCHGDRAASARRARGARPYLGWHPIHRRAVYFRADFSPRRHFWRQGSPARLDDSLGRTFIIRRRARLAVANTLSPNRQMLGRRSSSFYRCVGSARLELPGAAPEIASGKGKAGSNTRKDNSRSSAPIAGHDWVRPPPMFV